VAGHDVSGSVIHLKPILSVRSGSVYGLPFLGVYDGRPAMMALLDITTLTVATLFALAAATAFHWLLLRVAFRMMRPVAVRRVAVRTELSGGTRAVGAGVCGASVRWPGAD
jgi:hypothetical protein